MPRRFSLFPALFFALWALWFLLPTTRGAATHQWQVLFQPSATQTPLSPYAPTRDEAFIGATYGRYAYIIAPTPQNLELLGARFPDDASIGAAQIVLTSGNLALATTRRPGPSSGANRNAPIKFNFPPSPYIVPTDTLKSWFAVTERGARLEPDNAFWDWAKIIGLLAARRDSQVWPVLHAASAKTRYEDHVSEIYLTRLRVLQRQYGAPLPPITQLNLTALRLNHFSTMQEAARQINDNAIGLRSKGDPQSQKLALEGMRDFMRLARTLRLNAKRASGFFTGRQLEITGLYGGTNSLNIRIASVAVPPLSTYANDPQSLLFFARKMGRNDIAAQLNAEWTELVAWNRIARTPSAQASLIGLDLRDTVLAQAGDWLGTLLLAGVPSLLGLALLSSLALRFLPAWRREPESYPSSASLRGGVLLTLASVFVLSLSALWVTWRFHTLGYTGLLLLETLSIFGEPYGVRGVPPVWLSHFPAILVALFALGGAAQWESRRQGVTPLTTRLRRMGSTPEDGLTRFDLSPLLSLIGSLAGSCLCTAIILAFLVVPAQSFKFRFLYQNLYAIPILILTTLYLAVPLVWRLRTAPSWTFALALTRRFAWSQLVVLSLVWGALWMLAAPAQTRFDAALKRQLQIGEFQLLRQQLGL